MSQAGVLSSGTMSLQSSPWLTESFSGQSWYDGCASLGFLCRLHVLSAHEQDSSRGSTAQCGLPVVGTAAAASYTAAVAATAISAGAAIPAASATDPVLASKFCHGHVDDSDYDSHRAEQYKHRKCLTIGSRRASAAQQQQEQPHMRASPPMASSSCTAQNVVRIRRRHHSSKKAIRPSLGYTPTLLRLDEVDATFGSADRQFVDDEGTSSSTCDAVEASEPRPKAQEAESENNNNHLRQDYLYEGEVTDNYVAAQASREKTAAEGCGTLAMVQEAERSCLFLYTDNEAPIPSRLGRF